MNVILKNDISVRNFAFDDIAPTVSYLTENSSEYWLKRGVDLAKIKPKKEFLEHYTEKLVSDGDIPSNCTIAYKGQAIGLHSLSHIAHHDHAIMHAHIWSPEHRRKGIGYYSYPLAMDFFMKKFNFKKIIFKTPKINIAANKIKEKLQIPCLGDTIFEASVLIVPLEANLYEVDRTLLDQLLTRIQN